MAEHDDGAEAGFAEAHEAFADERAADAAVLLRWRDRHGREADGRARVERAVALDRHGRKENVTDDVAGVVLSDERGVTPPAARIVSTIVASVGPSNARAFSAPNGFAIGRRLDANASHRAPSLARPIGVSTRRARSCRAAMP
ncbi:MAG: hypothetical protein M5U28_48240 [Sandaracinaceae bacterium]|nr:hypothetical protein [Sandaracinaceae bacterium]